MVDAVVVRVPFPLERQAVAAASVSPVVNGGDGNQEHPTQALIDLLAMEEEQGPIGELRLGLCGDLRSRATRSLLKLLDRFPPQSLTLQAPPGRDDPGVRLGCLLSARTSFQPEAHFGEMDILYMVGLPEGAGASHLGSEQRAAFALTVQRLRELPKDAVVLSAMPVIDEIAPEAWGDRRVRIFAQSDHGVFVRAAVLELLLETTVPGGH
jgi:aspartate carbamoyltransferase catalytic subunit